MAEVRNLAVKGVRIGLVEDQPELVTLLTYNLGAVGFVVEALSRGDEAETRLRDHPPDLLLLDWMLPGLSGIELLRRLRRWRKTQQLPIIVVSARTDEADLIRALETGADDYISKPFSIAELLARIEALLRRRSPDRVAEVLIVGDIEFNRVDMTIKVQGKPVNLGPTDHRLLEVFIRNPGKVLNRQEILDAVWGATAVIDERTIDVHVGRLRKSLLAASQRDPITTIRGAGYRFDTC